MIFLCFIIGKGNMRHGMEMEGKSKAFIYEIFVWYVCVRLIRFSFIPGAYHHQIYLILSRDNNGVSLKDVNILISPGLIVQIA